MAEKNIDKAYEDLKNGGYNTVDNLVRWLKDAKILEKAQATENEAYELFAEADHKAKVTKEQFESVVLRLGKNQKKAAEDMMCMLADEGQRLHEALKAAAKAFADTLEKEKPNKRN